MSKEKIRKLCQMNDVWVEKDRYGNLVMYTTNKQVAQTLNEIFLTHTEENGVFGILSTYTIKKSCNHDQKTQKHT